MGGKLPGCGSAFSRKEVKETADKIASVLSSFKAYTTFEIAGSYRRDRPFCNDLDVILTVLNEEQENGLELAMKALSHPSWTKDRQNVSIAFGLPDMKRSIQVDLFIVRDMSKYATELMCWTGPYRHNIAMRRMAIRLGKKLSQHGLSESGKVEKTMNERDVFRAIGLPFIPPSKRDSYETEQSLVLLQRSVADGSFDAEG